MSPKRSCRTTLPSLSVGAPTVGPVKPYENLVTFEAMLIGYTEAINRFDAAANENDPVGTYTALFEALNWAVALDDRTDAHLVLDGKPVKYRWHERIPNAEVMGGVRYVRNSVHHQWSDAVVLRPSAMLPWKLPFPLNEWVWRPANQLPLPPPDKKPHPESEKFYREQMEGRPVRLYLDVLGGVFLTLQHLLEPYTVRGVPSSVDDYPFPEDEAGVLPD